MLIALISDLFALVCFGRRGLYRAKRRAGAAESEAFASPVTCLMHGQAYLANSALGRDLNQGETVKVICKPNRVVAVPHESGETGAQQEVLTQK